MNLQENIKEGLRSVQANLLRSVLTAAIVAIGIMSLVGILTAIDGIENSVNSSLADLGVNSFEISSKVNRGRSQEGVSQKTYEKVNLNQINRFVKQYNYPSAISVHTNLTGIAEVKRLSKKTNPNIGVYGVNEEYLAIKGLELWKGRNFSNIEIEYGSNVIVLGKKVFNALFDQNEDPMNAEVSFYGNKFRVIGVLVEKGQMSDSNYDNSVFIPLIAANKLAAGRSLFYMVTVGISDLTQMEYAIGEATGLMRKIRNDKLGDPNSFEIEKSETLAESFNSIISALQFGGFGVGFITLLGATIALMNIMMVSVTERTREVGVRKALGATPKRIRQQFLIEAIVVCVLGGFAGIIFGIGIGNLFANILGIKSFVLPWLWMMVGLIICIVVGLISGYYPAYKASKLDPIDSLRFE
ncbi:MAG TPA: ABC transporter permease [Cyclobacteriaceae bacterium]|nr:ABC transporter permease [Cyclobacteriaceae bacterium]